MATSNVFPGMNIQSAINNASSGTTLVFAAGLYHIANQITLNSGVSLQGQSGVVFQYDNIGDNMLHGNGVSNVTISGITFDGGSSGGAGHLHGAIFLEHHSHDIHITGN